MIDHLTRSLFEDVPYLRTFSFHPITFCVFFFSDETRQGLEKKKM